MKTKRLEITEEDIETAGEIIREGGLVAFPTETVYGLGADALNAEAVKSVYAAKGRPSDNPMIVHVSDFDEIPAVAGIGDGGCDRELVESLMHHFMPGPITFILNKKDIVPMTTTGGLETVGIRMPVNEIARRFIKAAKRPIAAPSANISGRPSPTTYTDVLEDMDGRIDAVLMGGQCDVGIESTVLDVTGDVPTILRPGYVTPELIADAIRETGREGRTEDLVRYDRALFERPTDPNFHPKAPGMKYKHYAPKAQVRIVKSREHADALCEEAKAAGRKTVILDYHRDSSKAAKDFFARMRELDREGVDLILVIALEDQEFGFSVMNRMLKSAGYDVVD